MKTSLSNLVATYKHWIFVISFFWLGGPGGVLLPLNKYTVSLLPLMGMLLLFVLYYRELLAVDWNTLLKSKDIWSASGFALKYSIFAHAVCTLLFNPAPIVTDVLLDQFDVMAVYIVLAGPLMEEIVYRKIIFSKFSKYTGYWPAAIVSSFIFATAHLSLDRFLAYFLVGLAFCHVYRKTGSIFPSIIAHGTLNFISVFMSTIRN